MAFIRLISLVVILSAFTISLNGQTGITPIINMSRVGTFDSFQTNWLNSTSIDFQRGISQILRDDPFNIEALMWRSHSYFETGDLYSAERDLSRILELRPDMTDAWYMRAHARMEQGDYEGALEDINDLITLEGETVHTLAMRIFSKIMSEDYESALEDIEEAMEIDEYDKLIWLYKGIVYHNLEDYSKALDSYDRALDIYADYGVAYYERAFTRLAMGDSAGACSDLNRAHDLGYEKAADAIASHCRG